MSSFALMEEFHLNGIKTEDCDMEFNEHVIEADHGYARVDILDTPSSSSFLPASCASDDDSSITVPSPGPDIETADAGAEAAQKVEMDRQLLTTLYQIDQHNYSYLYDRCEKFDICVRQLRYLTTEHIRMIIPARRVGVLAEFEYLHAKWKRKSFVDEPEQPLHKQRKLHAKHAASAARADAVAALHSSSYKMQQQPRQQPVCVTNQNDAVTSMLMALSQSNLRLQSRIDRSIAVQEQILANLALGTGGTNAQATFAERSSSPDPYTFKQIDTINEINAFEEQLENPQFYQKLCPRFYAICGPTSDLCGESVCYRLIDALFSRRFFTLVSWTGLSRSKENKENFSKFIKTFQFFHHLVNRCDMTFTEDKLKNFFQRVIDNSKRRYESAISTKCGKRISSAKRFLNAKKKVRMNADAEFNDNNVRPVAFHISESIAPQNAPQVVKNEADVDVDAGCENVREGQGVAEFAGTDDSTIEYY